MFIALLCLVSSFASATPISSIADIYGVRSNLLTGVGLVVGLNKSGDSSQNPAAVDAMAKIMSGLGAQVTSDQIKSRNIAMVMVTAHLPTNPMPGMNFDVQVASTGDAKSLEGGTLMPTQLMALNGEPYATAMGSLIVGGYSAGSGGESVVQNHPTVGIISGGGTVERQLPPQLMVDFSSMVKVLWMLREESFANVVRLADTVNVGMGCECAHPRDARVVEVAVPDEWLGRQVEFVAAVNALDVFITPPARVVVSERTGAVVMGADIVVHSVVVSLGGLTVEVRKNKEVSQPNALAKGDTAVVEQTEVSVNEVGGRITALKDGTVGDIVNALNDLGATPRQIIVLLQSMKAAGAIDAPILVQ